VIRLGGYKPDPADARDKPFALLRAVLKPKVAVIAIVVLAVTSPLSDQGPIGSCVANSGCDSIELLGGTSGGAAVCSSIVEALSYLRDDVPPPVQLSRLTGYFYARAQHGDECIDDGTYPRCFWDVGKRIGVPEERLWPYDVAKVNVRPPILAVSNAYDHRISGYFRITTRGAARGADVRAAIDSGHPVQIAVDVGKDFLSYTGGEHVSFEPPSRVEGGHAMVIVGYRVNADGTFDYLLRNSWGASWGLRSCPGHCWISERYLWLATDLWVPTQAWS